MQTTRTFTVVDPFTVRWSYHQKRSQWEEMETGNVGAGFKFWSIKTNLVNIWQASLWEFRLIISFPWTPKFSLKQALFKSALFWTWFYNGVEEKVYIKTNKQKPLSVFSAAIVSDRNVNCTTVRCVVGTKDASVRTAFCFPTRSSSVLRYQYSCVLILLFSLLNITCTSAKDR